MIPRWRVTKFAGMWLAVGLNGYVLICTSWAEAYAYAYEQARLAASEVP